MKTARQLLLERKSFWGGLEGQLWVQAQERRPDQALE
jgi:hypothetical protein